MRSKEAYFTAENLRSKSSQFLADLGCFRQSHASQRFDPAHAVLCVLDMQNYFLKSRSHAYVPSAPPIVAGIGDLVSAFCSSGRPVVFTQHINNASQAGMMHSWWKDLISPGTYESQIVKEFDPSVGTVLVKSYYDAFYSTSLDEMLKNRRVRQMVITGVLTHLCCESTARSAFQHNYEVFFTIDGTATYNEMHHWATLVNLAHGFALPVQVPEMLDAFHH